MQQQILEVCKTVIMRLDIVQTYNEEEDRVKADSQGGLNVLARLLQAGVVKPEGWPLCRGIIEESAAWVTGQEARMLEEEGA